MHKRDVFTPKQFIINFIILIKKINENYNKHIQRNEESQCEIETKEDGEYNSDIRVSYKLIKSSDLQQ